MSTTFLEEKLYDIIDELVGLEFAKQYNFTSEQIQDARDYAKKYNLSFKTAVLDLNIIHKLKEITKGIE